MFVVFMSFMSYFSTYYTYMFLVYLLESIYPTVIVIVLDTSATFYVTLYCSHSHPVAQQQWASES